MLLSMVGDFVHRKVCSLPFSYQGASTEAKFLYGHFPRISCRCGRFPSLIIT